MHTFSLFGHLLFPVGQGNERINKKYLYICKPGWCNKRKLQSRDWYFLLKNKGKATIRDTGFSLLRSGFIGTLRDVPGMWLTAVTHFVQWHIVELVVPTFSAQLFIYYYWGGRVSSIPYEASELCIVEWSIKAILKSKVLFQYIVLLSTLFLMMIIIQYALYFT